MRDMRRVRADYTPSFLFNTGAGATGAWYDPSDHTTLFQDSAGTTPANAPGDPVGLVLDKSQGLVLGPELVTNGTFDTDSDWTKGTGWTISGGTASFSNPSGTSLQQNVGSISAGTVMQVELDSFASNPASVVFNGVTPGAASCSLVSSIGTKRVYVGVVSEIKNNLSITALGTTVVEIDNISVRELPGHHAFQDTNDDFRPTLARHPASGLRNQLDASEDFTDPVWTKRGACTITPGDAVGPFGEANGTLVEGVQNLASGDLFAANLSGFALGGGLGAGVFIKRVSTTGTLQFNNPQNSADGQWNIDMSLLPDEWVFLTDTHSAVTVVNAFKGSGGNLAGAHFRTADTSPLSFHVAGVHLQDGATAPTTYQKRVNQYDVTEAGQRDVWYLAHDGIDDYLEASVPGMTSDMYLAVSIKTTDSLFLFLAAGSENYVGANQNGHSATFFHQGAGSPIIKIDGEIFTGATRGDLNAALADDEWHVVEFVGLNLSDPTWENFHILDFPLGGWDFRGSMGGMVLVETPTEAAQTATRRYLANKSGVTL